MTIVKAVQNRESWNEVTKIGFRFLFSFILLQGVVYVLDFIIGVFDQGSQGLHFLMFFDLVNRVSYVSECLILTCFVTIVWSYFDRSSIHYNKLYYWLRVVVRYRLAVSLFSYGIIKLFPIQMPEPTLSDLNTAYGDFLPWKIFWLTTGAASAGYESALGLLEIIAGGLLLFRITTSFGALLSLLSLANALGVNIAYQTGQSIYSLCLAVLSVFLLAYDIPRLYRLLILEKPVEANSRYGLPMDWVQWPVKLIMKLTVVSCVVGYALLVYTDYRGGAYLLPQGKGLTALQGYYEVTDFKLNGDTIPYSSSNPDRWQNVVFEKWATVSVKRHNSMIMDRTKSGFKAEDDLNRNYESAGTVGRHYFHYETDSLAQKIFLQNKNIHHRTEKWALEYSIDTTGLVSLSGENSIGDSVHMLLRKIDRRYLLQEGRRKPVKLSIFN